MTKDDFIKLLRIGMTFEVYYNEGNRFNRTYSIRAIVDDCQIVCRSKTNKEWTYEIKSIDSLWFSFRKGRITIL